MELMEDTLSPSMEGELVLQVDIAEMNPQQRILAEYTRLLEGMYQRTNYKTRAIGKQTWKGGFNAGLDASLDILKIVLKESGTIKTTNGKN